MASTTVSYPASRPDLGKAAARLAATLGPVFPLRPGTKEPLRTGWQREATRDPDKARALWRAAPGAGIGIACGPTCVVLDVDGQEGLDTLADLEDANQWLASGPLAETGTGGPHLYFAANTRVRNTVRRLGPGLDTRGAGGFVVAPPSLHPNGNAYRWVPGREPWTVALPPVPAWMLDLIDPPRPAVPARLRQDAPPKAVTPYLTAAIRDELERVATASKGQRNATLNRAAFALGRFMLEGSIRAADLGPALVNAAAAAGLDRREAGRTVASAFSAILRRVA